MAKRGRPVGTKKRERAIEAAQAICDGRFNSVREAASHFRPASIGSADGFRDFVGYVEEALREKLEQKPSFRVYRVLSARTKNRLRQKSEPRRLAALAELKAHLTDVLGWAFAPRKRR